MKKKKSIKETGKQCKTTPPRNFKVKRNAQSVSQSLSCVLAQIFTFCFVFSYAYGRAKF